MSDAGVADMLDPAMIVPVLVALLVVVLTVVLLKFIFGGRSSRNAVLLVGLCDSGKTTLFGQLTERKAVKTHTSIKKNQGTYKLQEGKKGSLQLVDLPGHERLRLVNLDEHKAAAKAIVYLLDSSTFQRELRDIAEFLYVLLVDAALAKAPFLIVCNKQDMTLAKSEKVVKGMLEKEINMLRVTRQAALEGTDGSSGNNNTFLGRKDKDFQFTQLQQQVTFVECSCLEGKLNITGVEDWINSVA
ncbi:signal recognition particle receptor subunit beta-like [Branchiostoma lanceolatum]|uniref:signal recognition particle receptor subunit beta-like n=1 Tax=Branchiostoma lanceolatum TaxID=7740 RepID=UPI003455EA6B